MSRPQKGGSFVIVFGIKRRCGRHTIPKGGDSMSLYGKLGGIAVTAALVGGAAAYIADIGGSVIADAAALSEQLSCYVIKVAEDGVALYKEGNTQPLAVYSLPVGGVGTADMKLLQEGIRLKGMDEVMRLLEDLDIEV